MDKKVEGLMVILLLVLVVFVVRAEITGGVTAEEELEIFEGLFDVGEGDIGTAKESLQGLGEQIGAEVKVPLTGCEIPPGASKEKIAELEAKCGKEYPQNIVKNSKEGDWSFKAGDVFPPKENVASDSDTVTFGGFTTGYLNCEGTVCDVDWLDWYSFAGCELNMLTVKMDINDKTEEISIGECGWYDVKENRPKLLQRNRLKDPGKLTFCPKYVIEAKCSQSIDKPIRFTNEEKTKIEGNFKVNFRTKVPSGGLNDAESEWVKDKKGNEFSEDTYDFTAEYIGPSRPTKSKDIPPGLYVGIGAAGIIAAGLAGMGAHSLLKKKAAAEAAASGGA